MSITKSERAFLRRVAGPQHWSEEDARRVLALREASGESEASFARRHGLRATRLAWWRRRLGEWTAQADVGADRAEATPTGADDGFVRLVMSTPPQAPTAATVHVGDVVVEFASVDRGAAEFVAALSRALDAGSCS